MVIVSSAKSLPKTKKKSLASASVRVVPVKNKKTSESKNVAVSRTSKFSRPAPRPLTVATASLVGVGRGKVKTTRNNTLPLPSPKSGLLANGPRIHAQRKFAQGASTTFANSGLASVHTGYSPAVTPTKDGNKFRKRVPILTPISPPLKRPKTEDFLTFLCFRGTPALPPELGYFNFSQPSQVDEIQVQSKRPKESVVSVSTGVGCTNTDSSNSCSATSSAVESVSNGPSRSTTASSGLKVTAANESIGTKTNGKQSIKTLSSIKNKTSTSVVPKKSAAVVTATSKEKTAGDGNGKKDSSVQKKCAGGTGKMVAKKTASTPQISPSTSRINEQDAKFAMTALKLKYQEKRLASARPAKSLITMLTKKVKERSMVLTRSKAKTAVGPLKTSPLQLKRKPAIVRPPVKPLPRNAPSPDIILGVAQSPIKPHDSRRSSPSGSDSSSSESKQSSSESSSSSSESEDEPGPTTRSLRSGKEVVTKRKPDQQKRSTSLPSTTAKKSSSPTRRMGTRASHRHTKSPLRELPMWNVNVKKKKILAKYKKNNAKAKAQMNKNAENSKNTMQLKSNLRHVTRSSARKSSGFHKGRPSRKTKETAAIYLGLMNKDFSSDDDESNGESEGEDRASSVGDTSSSETKFLEKHYKSSLKRNETASPKSKKDGKSTSSSTSSKQQDSKTSSKREFKKFNKTSGKSSDSNDKNAESRKSKKKEEMPLPRVLRSRSSGSVESNSRLDAAAAAAERRRSFLMTCANNTAGAARKSAKVVSRGRRSRNYSSSDDDASDKRESSSSDMEDEDEDNEIQSDSQSEEESEEKTVPKRDITASPMSLSSSRGSRAKVRRVAELINESKGSKSPSCKRSNSSSPVSGRSRSESLDKKSVKSDAGKSGDQDEIKEEMEVEEDEIEDELDENEVDQGEEDEIEDELVNENEMEKTEESEEEEKDEDAEESEEVEDEDDIVPSPVASVHESLKHHDSDDGDNEDSPQVASPVHSNSTSPTGSSASEAEAVSEEDEDEEEVEEEEEEEEDVPEPPVKVDMAIQVDMDLEEEQAEQEKRRQEEKLIEEKRIEEKQREEKRKEEKRMEEKQREEKLKEEKLREERLQEEKRREDKLKEERRREERLREEMQREEKLREENLKEEKRREEKIKEEKRREEKLKEQRRKEEEKRREERRKEKRAHAESCSKGSSARTSGIELPLSDQQRAELRQAQEEDDEIQEIGQVINNPSTLGHSSHHKHTRRPSPSPPIVTEPPRIHRPPLQQPEPVPIPMSIPIPLPPLTTRTSSLTYTSHHINLGGTSVPFVPYSTRPPTSDYFTHPPIHFGHTHLVNSVHLVGSSTTGHPGVDFTSELASPLSTLSIPVSVPTLSSFPNPLLPPAPPICHLGPGGTTMTATSLQTHIRTVATNLDIPLVRPVIGATDSGLSFSHFGAQPQLGSMPLLGGPPTTSLLSRPLGPWSQPGQAGAAAAAAAVAAAAEARNHYSAFRLPNLGQPPASGVNGPSLGVKNIYQTSVASSLPVSIVPPRTVPQPQFHSQNLHHSHHIAAAQQRDSHHHSSSSSTSSFIQNYNPESIIRTLPNVSIVPKFDRSSAKTQLPSQKPTASSSSSASSGKKHSNGKGEEPKKPGKKKSKPSTLPTPSSPLTVRKDSNPATYVGISSKLKKKSDAKESCSEKTSSSSRPSTTSSPKTSRPSEGASPKPLRPSEGTSPKISRSGDGASPKPAPKFDKLVVVKQERLDPHETPPTSTCSKPHSSKDCKGKSSPGPALIRLDQIKQEVGTCSSPTRKKSQSPSLSNSKQPDRPTSSNSAKVNCEESKKCSHKKVPATKKMVEAPTYYPTEQEFEDPLKYFDKIQLEAEKYGMARIVPPRSFRPECNVNDDMRFTAYNHYIHKMFKRWGPTVQETEAIKEHLKRSDVDLSSIPVVGGMEIDFSTLYQAVQSFGGLKEVIENEKWADVADCVHIPKGTHDRGTKLDSVYVKYILPYDLLSEEERHNLRDQVDDKWAKRQQKLQDRTDESSEDETSDDDSMDELDDCVIKGKGTPLSTYYRVARNTVGMIFPNGKEPPIEEIEDEYWKIVREGKKHLCVYSGSIDCAGVVWGFPAPKASSKHPWNLKVLANNQGSVLRSMGPVMGATVPTLHVSMLFTSYCWYRDPHGLPWVEYLHSGASKIWYSVAATHEQTLRKALMKLMPLQCKNKKLWLPSDSAMVPPELLMENDVPLVRAVQNPGEFLVVFPKSYTSAICAGYLVSESVCFAPPVWLKSCMELFKDIRDSKEPPVFPIEKLLLSIVRDNKVSSSVIKLASPLAEKVILEELALRKKLISMGVSQGGKPNKNGNGKGLAKKKKSSTEEEVEQCYFCNYILHMSLVRNERTDFVTCLPHAIQHLSRHKAQIKKCSLLCEETQDELESLLQTAKRRANT